MRAWLISRGAALALLGLLAAGHLASPGAGQTRADNACLTWSEAREAGWIERFNLRPASEIKESVEKRHGGKVVNFVLCPQGDSVVYQLSVFQPNGNVVFVTEPAQ